MFDENVMKSDNLIGTVILDMVTLLNGNLTEEESLFRRCASGENEN